MLVFPKLRVVRTTTNHVLVLEYHKIVDGGV